ncbi:MAG: hypothetical protein K0V04_28800 [Deltaproteobacteria bacterium]|nr:hypothetical protein [Deltaproteobacteria bacterium]
MITGLALLGCGDDANDPAAGSGDSTAATDDSTTNPLPGTTETPDPSTTSPTTGLDSTSMGPDMLCGNGEVDPGEDCDDENVDNDDACYSDCTLPFEILWTESEAGPDVDLGRDALFDADGNLYVLGSTEVAGEGFNLWLRQYAPDGSTGWTYTYNGALNDNDVGRRMAWLPDGNLVIVGAETTATGDDVLVMRFDPTTQTPVWTQYYDNGTDMGMKGEPPEDDTDFSNAVTVDIDGNILVAATTWEQGQEFDIWLRKYDGDGVEIWTQTYDNPMVNLIDSPDAVVSDAMGDIYLVGNTETENTVSAAWVRKMDTDGAELWTQEIVDITLTNATLDADDNLVLTGFDSNTGTITDMWTAKYDPEFVEIGAEVHDGPSGLLDIAESVTVGPSGDIYVTGFITVVGESRQMWVGRHSPDLSARWWTDSYGNEDANLDDEGWAVVVNDDGSRMAVVGVEAVVGEDSNIWVRMYQNNPTPQ